MVAILRGDLSSTRTSNEEITRVTEIGDRLVTLTVVSELVARKAPVGETRAPYSGQRFHTGDSCRLGRRCPSRLLLQLCNPNLHLLRLEGIVTTRYSCDRSTSRRQPSLYKPLFHLRHLGAFCHVCIAVRYQPPIGFLRCNVFICIFSVNSNYSKWQTVMYVMSRCLMMGAVCER